MCTYDVTTALMSPVATLALASSSHFFILQSSPLFHEIVPSVYQGANQFKRREKSVVAKPSNEVIGSHPPFRAALGLCIVCLSQVGNIICEATSLSELF